MPVHICAICYKEYRYKRNLKRHLREKHENLNNPWRCAVKQCAARFIRRNYLSVHLEKYHGFSRPDARQAAIFARREDDVKNNAYYERVSSDDDILDLIAEDQEMADQAIDDFEIEKLGEISEVEIDEIPMYSDISEASDHTDVAVMFKVALDADAAAMNDVTVTPEVAVFTPEVIAVTPEVAAFSTVDVAVTPIVTPENVVMTPEVAAFTIDDTVVTDDDAYVAVTPEFAVFAPDDVAVTHDVTATADVATLASDDDAVATPEFATLYSSDGNYSESIADEDDAGDYYNAYSGDEQASIGFYADSDSNFSVDVLQSVNENKLLDDASVNSV